MRALIAGLGLAAGLAVAQTASPSPDPATPAVAEDSRPAPPGVSAPASNPAPALAPASASVPASAPAADSRPAPPPAQWLSVPRSQGRLRARDLGLVVNTADPYSVAVGEYYAARRGLLPEQVLRVELPVRPELRPEEFDALVRRIGAHFGAQVQALALAWTQPYGVACNSLTGALALGFDAGRAARSTTMGFARRCCSLRRTWRLRCG